MTVKLPQIGHLHRAMEEPDARECNAQVLLDQITPGVRLAISGGRYNRIVRYDGGDTDAVTVGVYLPINKWNGIRVLYNWMDLYTVQRVKLHKDGSVTVMLEMADLFADNLAYAVLKAEDLDF